MSEEDGHLSNLQPSSDDPKELASPSSIPDELLSLVGASPPRFVTFEQLMSAANGIKNMTLAHEIAVNDNFQLHKQEAPPNSWEKKLADTVQRAFWDAFQEKLSQDPPDLSFAYSMMQELREALLDILLPQHQRLRDQICEVLDLPLLQQQMDKGVFDFDLYAKYITDVMSKLCAPARDENIAEIRAIQDVVPKFKAIIETLELMKRDMANFTIRQIRPYIQQNSIEYERKKFAEYFEAQRAVGINALHNTEVWLTRNYQKLAKSCVADPAVSLPVSARSPTPANVTTEAFLEVLEWSHSNSFPETLMMDQERFMAMRDTMHTLGLITSVQLIAFSVVGSSIEGLDDLKKILKEHVDILLQDVGQKGIKAVMESVADQVVKDVGESLESRSLPPLTESIKQTLRVQIHNLSFRESSVRKLMNGRLMSFIREGMLGQNVTNLQLPKGCTAVQRELVQILGSFLRLTSHNRSVFGAQYTEIIERLMLRSSSEPAASADLPGKTG